MSLEGTESKAQKIARVQCPPFTNRPLVFRLMSSLRLIPGYSGMKGKHPPPQVIRTAYEALIPPEERPRGPREEKSPNNPVFLLADGSETVDRIFAKSQCIVCHTIPGIPGAYGTIGPKLTLKTQGPVRLKDKNYRGKARTVREYIVESILDPSVYVTPGYRDYMMPRMFGVKLNGLAIDKMVDYLVEVEENKVPPRNQ